MTIDRVTEERCAVCGEIGASFAHQQPEAEECWDCTNAILRTVPHKPRCHPFVPPIPAARTDEQTMKPTETAWDMCWWVCSDGVSCGALPSDPRHDAATAARDIDTAHVYAGSKPSHLDLQRIIGTLRRRTPAPVQIDARKLADGIDAALWTWERGENGIRPRVRVIAEEIERQVNGGK